jgi:hypothetical protein
MSATVAVSGRATIGKIESLIKNGKLVASHMSKQAPRVQKLQVGTKRE